MSAKKEITQDRRGLMALLRQASYERSLYDVYRDFIEMGAIALDNLDLVQHPKREKRYKEIIGHYKPETQALFPKMLACLVGELERVEFDDVLGKTFMELELANKDAGQFFTPYPVCQVMARMTLDDSLQEKITAKGFVTVSDSACGGGATLIAFAEAMRAAGFNPQTQMHATAQDIDARSVHMTYLQLSLLHIPAQVILGDTIRMETREVWYTPAHIMAGWKWRLLQKEDLHKAVVPEVSKNLVPDAVIKPGQIEMFQAEATR